MATTTSARTTSARAPGPAGAAEALAERLQDGMLAVLEMGCALVGTRLGLYGALHRLGAPTSAELAAATGTDERYVREWLEQQAVAQILTVDDPAAPAGERRFSLPPAHAEVLLDPVSPSYAAAFPAISVGCLRPLEALLEGFRTGRGVPYRDYGADVREGIAGMNRPMFHNQLAGWLGAVPEVDARLRAQPPARVADLACGCGWSTIAIARAYGLARVDGIDLDGESVAEARANLAAADLGDRVRVIQGDAADPELEGAYDLVTIFEALHDMSRPVAALRAARRLLAEGGSVVVADERVADRFTPDGDPVERLMYGFSVLHCLAVGREDEHSAATGTVIRAGTVRRLAAEAGLGRVDVLPIENDFWRFYRLRP